LSQKQIIERVKATVAVAFRQRVFRTLHKASVRQELFSKYHIYLDILISFNCFTGRVFPFFSETGRVLTTMKAGDFFGEIGILNLDGLNK
jgi:hypothetical protein